MSVTGGVAFAFSVYLDEEFIGHHPGGTQVLFDPLEPAATKIKQFTFPATLSKSSKHVITISKTTCERGWFYAERQGWHLPGFDTSKWRSITPMRNGVDHAGVGFFVTEFDLDLQRDTIFLLHSNSRIPPQPADFYTLTVINLVNM
ncbi:hypothetical protein EV426DRAFT_704293 [Tirmania nivea]|nr:hypothetical protein EV426DRAFT_704293 [Tirmania nivea]